MKNNLLIIIFILLIQQVAVSQKLPIWEIIPADTISFDKTANIDSLGFAYKVKKFKFLSLQNKRVDFTNAFTLVPLYEAQITFDSYKKELVSNTGIGIGISTKMFKNKLEFDANFFQGSGTFTNYIDSVISKTNLVPNAGYANTFAKNAYYFWNNNFSIKLIPNKYLNITIGNDKSFIGEGYRSLLLGYNAYNYPNIKLQAKIWKFKYTSIFANFYDTRLSNGKISSFRNKYAAIHYLEWQIVKKLQLSFFESIIFQSRKEKGLGYDINYLNPFIFYRPVEYSLGSTDNSLLGANLLWTISKHYSIYGQLILDEFLLSAVRARKGWIDNKQGFQIGIKSVQKIGNCHLNLLGEFNYVRPFTYSHRNTRQNYSNYSISLAHPFGANFYELLGILKLKPSNDLQINLIGSYALIGYDKNGISYGQNINNSYINRVVYPGVPDEGNFVSKGLTTRQIIIQLKAYYSLNSANKTSVFGGFMFRRISNENGVSPNIYPFIGISTLVFKEGGIF